MKDKELLKLLKNNGWVEIRVTGSHHILVHKDFENPVSIPVHGKDMKIGLEKAILKYAKLK